MPRARMKSYYDLSFATLRRGNLARLPLFKNTKGEVVHSDPEGKDWSPEQWLQALIGEIGEYANVRKKFERGDMDEKTFLSQAGRELADVQTYLDLLAHSLDIDLGKATKVKWNEVSKRVGVSLEIDENGVHSTQNFKAALARSKVPQ